MNFNFSNTFLIFFPVLLISCFGTTTPPLIQKELTGVEWYLSPEKISYNQNEEVDFKCIIEPDFDYFECYNYKISFWNISETNIGNCDGVVEIEDESNQNPLDKYVTVFPYDADFDGNRIILSKKIKLLKKGTFDLAISVYALSFEYDNTRYEFYDKKRICIE